MRSHVFLVLLATAPLLACSTTETEGPRPQNVVPARVSASAPTVVQIQGVGFEPCVQADYDDERRSEVSFAFRAALEGGHKLEEVTWRSTLLLTARVPAGLAPARYTLTVTGPCGRQGSLAGGLEVLGGGVDGGAEGTTGEARLEAQPDGPMSLGAWHEAGTRCQRNTCHGSCTQSSRCASGGRCRGGKCVQG